MNLQDQLYAAWGELRRAEVPWERAISEAWEALGLEDEAVNHRWFCEELSSIEAAPHEMVEALFCVAVLRVQGPPL